MEDAIFLISKPGICFSKCFLSPKVTPHPVSGDNSLFAAAGSGEYRTFNVEYFQLLKLNPGLAFRSTFAVEWMTIPEEALPAK